MHNTDTDSTSNGTIAIVFATVIVIGLLVFAFRNGILMNGGMMTWWR